jgi:UDP-N-acetylmuramoylalanine--D-glutamate ligase
MRYLILGRGKTGVSVFNYLTSQKHQAIIFDTREASVFEEWEGIDQLVMSPGLDPSLPIVAQLLATAKQRSIRVTSDIELFLEANRNSTPSAKVIGITGSNGKSTVSALVFEMLKASGKRVKLGGNFGIPALDLLDSTTEWYVLELSSFQLDLLTKPPGLTVATVLNVSPNHLDRHGTIEAYRRVKEKIYEGALHSVTKTPTGWGGCFHAQAHEDQEWFFCGTVPLMPAASLRVLGHHNRENALAALALVFFALDPFENSICTENRGVSAVLKPSLEVLQSFTGLPHRCRWVATIDEIGWINDSKSTTAASTEAALEGFGPQVLAQGGRLLLIAGGQAKGATFESLQRAVAAYVKGVIVFGQDADQLKKDLSLVTNVFSVKNLSEAVMLAKKMASPKDTVLLSPACASLDMFKNYEDRGEHFEREVAQLSSKTQV